MMLIANTSRNRYHTITMSRTPIPPYTSSSGSSDERRQDEQSRYRRFVSRSKMRAVVGLRAKGVDAMNACNQHLHLSPPSAPALDAIPQALPIRFRPASSRIWGLVTAAQPAPCGETADTLVETCKLGHSSIQFQSNVRISAQYTRLHWTPPPPRPLLVYREENWLRRQRHAHMRNQDTPSLSASLTAIIAPKPAHSVVRPPRGPMHYVPTCGLVHFGSSAAPICQQLSNTESHATESYRIPKDLKDERTSNCPMSIHFNSERHR